MQTDTPITEEALWQAILDCQGETFQTARGLPLVYTVRGGELFFDRKRKSITYATVMMAFHQAQRVQQAEGCVSGPKKLGTFGASYLYPIFLRLGVCRKNPMGI